MLLFILRYWKYLLVAMLPLIPVGAYFYGKMDNTSQLEQSIKNEKAKNKFKIEMERKSDEIERNRPADRDELIDRLRKHDF